MKDSVLEAVEPFNAPQVQYQSKTVVGFVAQISSEVAPIAAIEKPASKNSNPMRGILWQGFLNTSPTKKGDLIPRSL